MAPTALETLVSKRDAVADKLDYIDIEVKDNAVNPLSAATVSQHLLTIADLNLKVDEIHTKIRGLFPADIDVHKREYHALLGRARGLHNALHGIEANFPAAAVPVIPVPVPGASSGIKLPLLHLNSFDGNLLEWISFRDLFSSSIHNNNEVPKIRKFTYLQSLLKGEASKQIQSLVLSEANYDIAWAQLNDRYQNDRELLFAVLRKFLSQQNVQGSSTAIRALVDTSKECIRTLEILNLPSDKSSEAMMLYILVNKLDQTSREQWEQGLKGTTVPPLKDLFEFLEQRARALAASGPIKVRQNRQEENNRRLHVHHGQTGTQNCRVCNESYHPLFKCTKFHALAISEKYEVLKKHNMCFNCLGEGHSSSKCTCTGRCKICKSKHHSLLHKPNETKPSETASPTELVLAHHVLDHSSMSSGMLATAIILVRGSNGLQYPCRGLLDGGSTATIITESCCNRLGLRRTRNSATVVGLATANVGTTRGESTVVFSPRTQSTLKYTVNAFIMNNITGNLPLYKCDHTAWSHLKGLNYADPEFYKPAPIDILLGSDVFWSLLEGGTRSGNPNHPLGIKSTLGWLVAGRMSSETNHVRIHVTDIKLNEQLQSFWELESVSSQPALTSEEIQCEEHYAANHSLDFSGRFTVSIPWKEPRPALGESRERALRRLHQLERRLSKNPHHQQQYTEFMKEYLTLGHMSPVPASEILCPLNPTYFIPHHFVEKLDSTTTKLRVVFDASARTSSGYSLNDMMLVGPQLQDNLVDIVMRFRLYPVAFTADIEKMYRQIRVTPKDTDLQRILWRESPSSPVQEFRLETVTYGTASAPYLAVKTLQQLSKNESSSCPLAAAVCLNDSYVDDIMSSCPSVPVALKTQQQLLEMMSRGGFILRKWSSNCETLIKAIPETLRETNPHLDINMDPSVKTLGIRWNTRKDHFEFQYVDLESTGMYTKRRVLSEMSKLFDPVGWFSPIIVRAKILMQSLWKLNLGWDAELPSPIQRYWIEFKLDLKNIDQINIPRCIIPRKAIQIDLAGFSDASEKAYAAVIYLYTKFDDGTFLVSLITSKSRVAPAKPISLPRLELCGASLLCQLMESVKQALKIEFTNVRAWTDSTVVLAWIKSHPSRWKTFVANRVTSIQNIIPASSWSHVPGTENPADFPSRGLNSTDLRNCEMWWRGPTWLPAALSQDLTDQSSNTQGSFESIDITCELKKETTVVCNVAVPELDSSLLCKYSSITQLTRITAWILRFYCNLRNKSHSSTLTSGPLTPLELQIALKKWILIIQQQSFSSEIDRLRRNVPLSSKSKLLPLNIFLDSDGLLRVGGRLRNAPISPDRKTPILLPRHSKLTELLINTKHREYLHAGPNLLLSILQQRYWIVRGKDAVRFLIRKCVVCSRQQAVLQQQFMADLPSSRVTPVRAFQRVGVDYAGPFLLKPDVPRSKTAIKAYLCLFVCFSTRAFHLETVSTLSTDGFIAALRRFVSRRGRPTDIHSDCGTNFVGANRELKELLVMLKSDDHNDKISNNLSSDGIRWHFNPAGAPHFGGLWEAGVKSVKFHLKRIIGSTRLTFEELSTTFAQIEACLNSRPLTPLSSDPEDLSALTSGHFLIGQPLVAIPEPDLTRLNQNKLSRWQAIQSFQQQFWRRWSREYLTRLQQRPKWIQQRKDIQIGDLVIIKEDNLPPQKWKLGRIITIHPGKDNLVRVVTLKTGDGEIKRPIHKLCLLPIENLTPEPNVDCI